MKFILILLAGHIVKTMQTRHALNAKMSGCMLECAADGTYSGTETPEMDS